MALCLQPCGSEHLSQVGPIDRSDKARKQHYRSASRTVNRYGALSGYTNNSARRSDSTPPASPAKPALRGGGFVTCLLLSISSYLMAYAADLNYGCEWRSPLSGFFAD